MAMTPDEYRDAAEAALTKAKTANNTQSSAAAAQASAHASIADGYTALYEATKDGTP